MDPQYLNTISHNIKDLKPCSIPYSYQNETYEANDLTREIKNEAKHRKRGVVRYLSSKGGDGVSSTIETLEKIISTPLDDLLNMIKLSSSLVLCAVLNHTPTQHSNGKRSRKVKLDSIPGIIEPTHQILNRRRRIRRLPILHTGVPPPRDIVMLRQFPGCNSNKHKKFRQVRIYALKKRRHEHDQTMRNLSCLHRWALKNIRALWRARV